MDNNNNLRGEDRLNHLFAEMVRESLDFRSWLLRRTKFKKWQYSAHLLDEAVYLTKPRKFWWRHWWCANIPGCGEKETDIFLVFEIPVTKKRFALHIENKLWNGKFTYMQAECYKARGEHM